MKVYFFNLRKITSPLNDYPLLEEMLALRALGWSYTMLSDRYKVPKYTIRWIARKFGLAGTVTTVVIRQRTTTQPPQSLYSEEKVNPGKTYAQYLQDEKDRKRRHLIQGNLNHAK